MDNPDILMVDDDADLTAAISAILENEGYSVAAASNRAAGMESWA